MISITERQDDILKLISQLDISPTMYNNAVEKYKALASFLEDCGIEAAIYPQGSFAFGTIVRPSYKDPDANYDLDFICQLYVSRDDVAPSELRAIIETALRSSDRYGGKLTKCGECFTIEYADINGVGFSIDIVPAADENVQKKYELQRISDRPDLIETAIAIPRQNSEHNYTWLTNNPQGFKSWFDEINEPFLEYHSLERRTKYFNDHRIAFDSVEDIPSELDRSAMQRVIQILKYHRDNYYQNLPRKDHDDIKPISAIINTLVADISRHFIPTSDVFALLTFVLNALDIYAKQQAMRFDDFRNQYKGCTAITRENGKWKIKNPANPEDNLADKWNENADIPKLFFKWVRSCRMDLIDSMQLSDDKFRTQIENAFGFNTVKRIWGSKYSVSVPKPIDVTSASKPYHSL